MLKKDIKSASIVGQTVESQIEGRGGWMGGKRVTK